MAHLLRVSFLCLVLLVAMTAWLGGALALDPPLLVWHDIKDAKARGALCNDFSPAGYFLRTNHAPEKPLPGPEPVSSGSGLPHNEGPITPDNQPDENHAPSPPPRSKWVVYLEGGGGCVSPKSCNERFIEQRIREKFTTLVSGSRNVDVAGAWEEFHRQPLTVTSKLMTSLARFAKEGYVGVYRRNASEWGVEGTGLLSVSPDENPDFHEHNHVLVPYCSSDLWLKKTQNYRKALSSDFSFQFDPQLVEDHQFTFRGMAIFRSVVSELFEFHGLSGAREVVLAGSSAGGVGAMNHAGWLQEELREQAVGVVGSGDWLHQGLLGPVPAERRRTKVYLVMDSAWFIDFRGEITNQV